MSPGALSRIVEIDLRGIRRRRDSKQQDYEVLANSILMGEPIVYRFGAIGDSVGRVHVFSTSGGF